jgi:dTDP-4-amino-4,6-dideoxygalactose transaminase
MTINKLFCGQTSTSIRHILGVIPKSHNINSWFGASDIYRFHKARIGIRHSVELLQLKTDDEVLAPAYHCGSEIDALLKSGVKVTLYGVDRNCNINIPDIKNRITAKTKAIYITHFFGFPQDVVKVKQFCEQNKLYLIEDCAMSLFSCNGTEIIGTTGDLAVFSLAKTLPVPDGGLLVINNAALGKLSVEIQQPPLPTIVRRLLPFIKSNLLIFLSKNKLLHPFYSILFNILNFHWIVMAENELPISGESMMSADLYYNNAHNKLAMSNLANRMLKAFVPDEIKLIRRRNYCLLADILHNQNNLSILHPELPDGVCPLNFPIIIENRDFVRLELYKRGIDADAFGKCYHKDYSLHDYPDSNYLKNHILSLPIHQNLDTERIRYIADNLLNILGEV